jgi:hypothetical protein
VSNLVDRHRRGIRVVFAAACAGLLAACASNTGKFPAAPTTAATQGYSYVIGPGDNLNIIVWRNPELSMSVPVRPDGKFSTPLIDELTAQGKTSIEISRDIEKQLGKYVRDPVVTFHEAAVQTEASARKRLGYRLLRTIMVAIFGPFGNFAARTGRSAVQLDHKIARLMPHSRLGFGAFTAVTSILAIGLLSMSREPASLLGAAACARLAASGGAALLWWNYRDLKAMDEDDDADE